MKKTILSILIGLFGLFAANLLADPDQNRVDQMTLGITSIPASSTNITTAQSSNMVFQTGPSACRIYLTAQAVSGSANTTGDFHVVFESSPDASTFDSATINNTAITNATLKLGMTLVSTNSQTVSDWFNVSGVRALRVGRVVNGTAVAVTNMVIKVGYPNQ